MCHIHLCHMCHIICVTYVSHHMCHICVTSICVTSICVTSRVSHKCHIICHMCRIICDTSYVSHMCHIICVTYVSHPYVPYVTHHMCHICVTSGLNTFTADRFFLDTSRQVKAVLFTKKTEVPTLWQQVLHFVLKDDLAAAAVSLSPSLEGWAQCV